MKGLLKFIFSRTFLIQLMLAVVAGVLVVWIALKLTGVYAHHGELIEVPNVKRMKLNDAYETIKDKRLRYRVIDSMFNRDAAPGSVIEQFPRSGSEVKRHRVVKLTIAAIAPQQVTIEKVRDVSLRQAIGMLSKQGIFVSRLEYVTSSYTNLVQGIKHEGKDLKVGDKLYKGEEVVLIVGSASGARSGVPNLIGLSETYARRVALESGVNIGKITYKDNKPEARKASRVASQSLRAGATVSPGGTVDIQLAIPKDTEE